MKRTMDDLAMIQALPLDVKLNKTAKRAKDKGMSYGQYKAQEYEVKVEFPWRKKK